MSWEASELWVIEVNIRDRGSRSPTFKVTSPMRIAGDRDYYSVGEPVWFNSTALVFTSNGNDHSTPWVYDLDLNMGEPLFRTVFPTGEDFSAPAFQCGCCNLSETIVTRFRLIPSSSGHFQCCGSRPQTRCLCILQAWAVVLYGIRRVDYLFNHLLLDAFRLCHKPS